MAREKRFIQTYTEWVAIEEKWKVYEETVLNSPGSVCGRRDWIELERKIGGKVNGGR